MEVPAIWRTFRSADFYHAGSEETGLTDLIPTLGHACEQRESGLSGWAKMRRMRPRSTDPC
jgi:hypothetical protein